MMKNIIPKLSVSESIAFLFFLLFFLFSFQKEASAGSLHISAQATQALASGQPQQFIVEYDSTTIQRSFQGMTIQAQGSPVKLQGVIRKKAQAYQALKQKVNAGLPGGMIKTIKDFTHFPLSTVEVSSSAALAKLLAQPGVKAVYQNKKYTPQTTESFSLINQPAAIATGNTGSGTTVAVLDTGVDYTRASFGSCTAPGSPANCRVVYAADIAANDGTLDDATTPHGSTVSEIIAGLATGAQLAVLDVFTGSGGTLSASSTDIIAGLNWVITNQATYNIVSVNLSLGDNSSNATQCSSSVYATVFSNLLAAGVMPVVSSGNNGFKSGITDPACVPGAVSVGSVYDANVGSNTANGCTDTTTAADQVTCYSNSVSYLSLLAPGSVVSDTIGFNWNGTSMAAPMVAGAIAVLRSSAAFPNDTTTQILTRLTSTGTSVTDALSGITTPRIDVNAALSQTTIPVNSVALTPSNPTISTVGNTQQLVATATYNDNSQVVVTNAATYSSSNTAVATVNSTGLVTAVASGNATITATYGGTSGTTVVTVGAVTVSSLAISPSAPSITAYLGTQQLTVTATYSDATTQDVTSAAGYSIDNSAIATVSNAGLLTGVSNGTATVTVTYQGVSATATVTVNMPTVSSLAISPSAKTLAGQNQTVQLAVTATLSDGSTLDVTNSATYTSSNTSSATVSSSGLVTSASPGTAVITATYQGVSSTSTITVTAPTLSSIAISPSTMNFTQPGSTQQLTVTATYSDATTQDVTTSATYTSSDTTLLEVSSTGLVTPKYPGTGLTVTATYNGVSSQANVTIAGTVPTLSEWGMIVLTGLLLFRLFSSRKERITIKLKKG